MRLTSSFDTIYPDHPPVTTPPPISVEERRRSTAHQRPHTSSSASRPRSDHERDETSADVEVVGEGDYGVGILDRDSLSRNPLPQSVGTMVMLGSDFDSLTDDQADSIGSSRLGLPRDTCRTAPETISRLRCQSTQSEPYSSSEGSRN